MYVCTDRYATHTYINGSIHTNTFALQVHKSKSHHGCVFLANGDVLDDSLQYAASQTTESWARCVCVCADRVRLFCVPLCVTYDVCMHACMNGSFTCMHACIYVCTNERMNEACMYVFMHACMYVCMYASTHACMHICIPLCTYRRTEEIAGSSTYDSGDTSVDDL